MAEVVCMIFELAAEGKTKGWIAKYLNDEGIPTPGEYSAKKGMKRRCAATWRIPCGRLRQSQIC